MKRGISEFNGFPDKTEFSRSSSIQEPMLLKSKYKEKRSAANETETQFAVFTCISATFYTYFGDILNVFSPYLILTSLTFSTYFRDIFTFRK
jgi:hypothetical protein